MLEEQIICEKRVGIDSMWFCELVWFIRGTVKEEHSVPPVDERCLFGIESG